MRGFPRRSLLSAVVASVLLFAGAGPSTTTPASAQGGPSSGKILLTFAPGGVLTSDGTLWTYNLEKGVWMTVDEGFAEQGQTTKVHPLPVPANDIAQMESFGFIVTGTGSCWLYDLEKNRWKQIGPPPGR